MDNDNAQDRALEPVNPLWRLHPYLSLREAAALVAGYEPAQIEVVHADTYIDRTFPNFAPALSVLTGAVLSGELLADIARTGEYHHMTYVNGESEGVWQPVGDDISSTETRIRTDNLRGWLASKGYRQGFFFPEAKPDAADYLDDTHPLYSRSLAAAVRAWIAFKEIPGKSPKQALGKWLREHAAEYGLTNDDGNPLEAAIDRCATVANWQTVGGAPKTPGANLPTP